MTDLLYNSSFTSTYGNKCNCYHHIVAKITLCSLLVGDRWYYRSLDTIVLIILKMTYLICVVSDKAIFIRMIM